MCFQHFIVYCSVSMISISSLYQQYQFRKRPLPPSDDEEQRGELAAKLMKYNVSLPAYVGAIEDTNNLW